MAIYVPSRSGAIHKYTALRIIFLKPVLTTSLCADSGSFLSSGRDASESGVWPVPLLLRTSAGSVDVLLDTKAISVISTQHCGLIYSGFQEAQLSVAVDGWIKGNRDQNGIYRVAYSPDLLQGWKNISQWQYHMMRCSTGPARGGPSDGGPRGADWRRFGTITFMIVLHSSLISDHYLLLLMIDVIDVADVDAAFALAVGGYGSTTGALDVLLQYTAESQYIVWSEIDQRCVHRACSRTFLMHFHKHS